METLVDMTVKDAKKFLTKRLKAKPLKLTVAGAGLEKLQSIEFADFVLVERWVLQQILTLLSGEVNNQTASADIGGDDREREVAVRE